MGNWSEKQDVRKETKERDKTRKETLGKYFFNLSQLIFVGLFVGGIISFFNGAINWQIAVMILFGIFATFLLALVGNNILK